MPKEPTPKSPEIIKAQVAAYASERVGDRDKLNSILTKLGSLAASNVNPSDEYVDFLRSVGGSNDEAIQGRADILTAYGAFAPAIDTLREELADSADRDAHSAVLGSGSNSMVFSIKHEGKEYAVRVPTSGSRARIIDKHVAGAVLGSEIPRLEKIVAASYETGVTVAEMMPGKEMGDLSVEAIARITDEQLGEFADTVIAANGRGITMDPRASNVLYDPAAGFGIVDYDSSKRAGKKPEDLGKIVGFMAAPLSDGGLFGKFDKYMGHMSLESREDYAHDLSIRKANLDVLTRYRSIVESKLTGEDQKEALEEIDKHIRSNQKFIDNYSNPDWVTEQIVQKAERKNRRRKPTPADDESGDDLVD